MTDPKQAKAHTPGPWQVWTSNSFRRIVSRLGTPVCEPVTQPDGHPDLYFRNGGEDGPDARLLAAAPELLALVERTERHLREYVDAIGVEGAPKSNALLSDIRLILSRVAGHE